MNKIFLTAAIIFSFNLANAQTMENKKVTAGRDQLGIIAPKFAELNDDVLFGQVWSREAELSARDRSVVTIVSLIAGGNFEQLKYHLQRGRIMVCRNRKLPKSLRTKRFIQDGLKRGRLSIL